MRRLGYSLLLLGIISTGYQLVVFVPQLPTHVASHFGVNGQPDAWMPRSGFVSFFIVMQMRAGRTPQQACEDALQLIIDKYKKVNPNFFPGEKFVALNKKGEFGCARMKGKNPARMSVMNRDGFEVYSGSTLGKPW